jgi:hypothetical protein
MPKIRLKSGEVREYSARDARLLVLVKRGTLVDDESDSKSIQLDAVEQKEINEKPKRTYSRKDLKASA